MWCFKLLVAACSVSGVAGASSPPAAAGSPQIGTGDIGIMLQFLTPALSIVNFWDTLRTHLPPNDVDKMAFFRKSMPYTGLVNDISTFVHRLATATDAQLDKFGLQFLKRQRNKELVIAIADTFIKPLGSTIDQVYGVIPYLPDSNSGNDYSNNWYMAGSLSFYAKLFADPVFRLARGLRSIILLSNIQDDANFDRSSLALSHPVEDSFRLAFSSLGKALDAYMRVVGYQNAFDKCQLSLDSTRSMTRDPDTTPFAAIVTNKTDMTYMFYMDPAGTSKQVIMQMRKNLVGRLDSLTQPYLRDKLNNGNTEERRKILADCNVAFSKYYEAVLPYWPDEWNFNMKHAGTGKSATAVGLQSKDLWEQLLSAAKHFLTGGHVWYQAKNGAQQNVYDQVSGEYRMTVDYKWEIPIAAIGTLATLPQWFSIFHVLKPGGKYISTYGAQLVSKHN